MSKHENQEQAPIEPRRIGFIERRWNMVKAFAKKSYEHLFSIKTWVSAAVIFGGMAYLSTGVGGDMGKAVAGFFSVTKDNWPLAIGKALAMGTMLNAGIAMYKEAARCDECDKLATQVEQVQRDRAQGLARAPEVAPRMAEPEIEVPQVPTQLAAGKPPHQPQPQGWGVG